MRPIASLRSARAHGFTAVEMITVVALLVILLTMTVTALAPSLKKGRVNEALSQVQNLHRQAVTAARMYMMGLQDDTMSVSPERFNLAINGFTNQIQVLKRVAAGDEPSVFSSSQTLNPNVIVFFTTSDNPRFPSPTSDTFSVTVPWRRVMLEYEDQTALLVNPTVAAPAAVPVFQQYGTLLPDFGVTRNGTSLQPYVLYVIIRPIDMNPATDDLKRQARAAIYPTGVFRDMSVK